MDELERKEKNQRVLLVGIAAVVGCLLLFIESILYVGLTFTAPTNIGVWLRVFLLFGCLLDLPALILGILWPRLGGYWLAANAGISGLLYIIFQVHGFLGPRSADQPSFLVILKEELLFQWKPFLFLGFKLLCAYCLLMIARSRDSHAHAQQKSSIRKIVEPVISVITGCYVFGAVVVLFSWYMR